MVRYAFLMSSIDAFLLTLRVSLNKMKIGTVGVFYCRELMGYSRFE